MGSSGIKIDPKNKAVFLQLDKSQETFDNGIRAGLHDIGSENVRHLRKLIRSKEKTGRIYLIGGRMHQASAPGEAPANLTGQLARTAGYKVRGAYQVEFGDRAFYGRLLEDGTKKMAPRPHVKRTVTEKEKDNFNSLKIRGL